MGKKKTVVIDGAAEEKTAPQASPSNSAGRQAGGQAKKAVAESSGPQEPVAKAERQPKKRSGNYKSAKAKVDRTKLYSLPEAVKLVQETSYSKFDGSVELHAVVRKNKLSVNTKLPHSTGKSKKIEIATDRTIEKLKSGKVDFDVLLAKAEMMPKLVPFAKILGPKGLMPNPKAGTLIKSETDAKKFSADTLTLKTEKKQPVVHVVVGKVKQDAKELEENVVAVFAAIGPKQVVKASLSASMGPGVKVKVG